MEKKSKRFKSETKRHVCSFTLGMLGFSFAPQTASMALAGRRVAPLPGCVFWLLREVRTLHQVVQLPLSGIFRATTHQLHQLAVKPRRAELGELKPELQTSRPGQNVSGIKAWPHLLQHKVSQTLAR